MPYRIRSADLLDSDAILSVVAEAFAHAEGRGSYEVDVVRRTWDLDLSDALELVAVDAAGHVVGHVLAAPGTIGDDTLHAVAPLAVRPSHQAQGVGTALMHELIARADRRGWPVLLLLGDQRYYSRFGFVAAAQLGLTYRPAGADSPYFQVLRLSAPWGGAGGEFRYAWEDAPESGVTSGL